MAKKKNYTKEEVIKIARYIIATKNSYTATAKVFNMHDTTVGMYIKEHLPKIDMNLYEKVMKIVNENNEKKTSFSIINETKKEETIKKLDDCIYKILKQSNEECVKITEKMIMERIDIGYNALYRYRNKIVENPFCRYTRIKKMQGNAIIYLYKLKPE